LFLSHSFFENFKKIKEQDAVFEKYEYHTMCMYGIRWKKKDFIRNEPLGAHAKTVNSNQPIRSVLSGPNVLLS
jgi:hypothetical protein